MNALSVFAAAEEQPDSLALIDGAVRLTFRELAAEVEPLSSALSRARPRALALAPRADLRSLCWLYAAFAVGVPVLTLHGRAPRPERERLSALAGASPPPPLAFTGPSESAPIAAELAAEGTLAIIPTSGSTGTPRLALISRRAALASASASAANLGWQAGDRWLLCLPLSHTGGLSVVVRTLLARRPVVLFEPGERGLLSRSAALGELVRESHATLLSVVPSLLESLLDAGFVPPGSLRAVLVGGSGCSPALAERAARANVPLLTSYGLTETCSQVVTRRYAERFAPLPTQEGCPSSGHPLPGVELALRNGIIAIRSPSLFSGYLGDSEPHLDSEGWLVTSDLGVLGSDGCLFVRGRVDDVIVTAGENVDPLEVEAALGQLPGVKASCVFGVPSSRFGSVVAAVIVGDDTRLADPAFLASALAGRLARHKHPRRSARVPELSLTESGKPNRRLCAALYAHLLLPPED